MPLTTYTAGEVLTAASLNANLSFAASSPAGGLTLISATTFTTATSVSLPNGSFSATYQNYKVQILVTATTAQSALTARFRTAGSDNTTARYNQASAGRDSGGNAVNISQSDATSFSIGTNFSVLGFAINLDIFDPFAATQTLGNGFYTINGNPAGENVQSSPTSIEFRNTTSFDSFTVISSVASSMTGVARVYGYANSQEIMTNPNIFDGTTDRLMTDAEYAQWQTDAIETQARAEAAEAKAAAREAVLDKLGLTADEAAALLG